MGGGHSNGSAIADRHRWIWRENRAYLARLSRARRLQLLHQLALVRYLPREMPDKGATIEQLIERGEGDCEDLCAGWHTILETLLPDSAEVISMLIPAGKPGWWHVVILLNGRWFDPSVEAGMTPIPPAGVYDKAKPKAHVIERREVRAF